MTETSSGSMFNSAIHIMEIVSFGNRKFGSVWPFFTVVQHQKKTKTIISETVQDDMSYLS